MHRVLRGVIQHVACERTHRPVGALMLLFELDAEESLEERGEAEGADAKELRREARVEDVTKLPIIILMQQPQVIVGIVKDDLYVRVLQ